MFILNFLPLISLTYHPTTDVVQVFGSGEEPHHQIQVNKNWASGEGLNSHADALTSLASIFEREIVRTIIIDLISGPNHEMQQESILVNTELGLSWMDPIVIFLWHDKLPEYKR